MNNSLSKVALGGGCHWCTEAVFQSLIGVERVEQGYVASKGENTAFSEGVIVHFNPEILPLSVLLEVHLRTHKSTSNHCFRAKYRSAVYTFSEDQAAVVKTILEDLQRGFKDEIITASLPFSTFKASRQSLHNYYLLDPDKPFCINYIKPKLKLLLQEYSLYFDTSFFK